MTTVIPRPTYCRLLIVEDDAGQLRTLTDILHDEGFEVTGCTTAAAAYEQLKRRAFDLAIVDLKLPDIDGIDLLEQIRSGDDAPTVIIHTGYGSFDSAKNAVNLGAFAYVEKLSDPDELMRHVHRAVGERMAAALRVSQEKWRSLVENAPDQVAICDVDSTIQYLNRSAAGHDVDALIGHTRLSDLVARRYHDTLLAALHEVFEHGASVECTVASAEKRRWYSIHLGPIHGEGEIDAAIAIIRDTTAHRAAEEQLRHRDAELAHVTRLSTMGEVAAQLAHEINQPLYAIANFAEACQNVAAKLVAGEGGDADDLLGWTQRIGQQARRAAAIVQRLRSYIRKDDPELVGIDVNHVVAEVVQLLDVELESHQLEAELHLANDLPQVMGDLILIEQVLVNLVHNALEAMQQTPIERRRLVIRTRRTDDGYVNVAVADRGPGVAAEQRETVFEPFFTTKESGIGLGLAICRSTIQVHGGHLGVAANDDGGATFWFELPAAGKHA